MDWRGSMRERTIEENKALIKEFPFLLPRNRFSGKVSEDYDYSYTEIDMGFPEGWFKAFGMEMLREIKAELVKINYLEDYRVMQIKEKYGSLRWYDSSSTKEIVSIVSKYARLSELTCIRCGAPATKSPGGWISPFCDTCYNDERNGEPLYLIKDGEWIKQMERRGNKFYQLINGEMVHTKNWTPGYRDENGEYISGYYVYIK